MTRLGLIGISILSLLVTNSMGCGGGGGLGQRFEWSSSIGYSEPGAIAGSSTSDIWGSYRDVASETPIHHFDGAAWTVVAVPPIDTQSAGTERIASAGPSQAWIASMSSAGPILVRVGTSGVLEDRSADIAPAKGNGLWIISGNGGVFAYFGDPIATGNPLVYRLSEGKFIPVPGVPSAPQTWPLLVLGPDELYLATLAIQHYKAGTWSTPGPQLGAPVRAAASSPTDVWFLGAGASGMHGDGMAWSTFTVLNWNSGVPIVALAMAAPGDARFLVNAAGAAINAVRMDSMSKVTGQDHLVDTQDCTGSVCYPDSPHFVATFSDGTILLAGTLLRRNALLEAWYAVSVK